MNILITIGIIFLVFNTLKKIPASNRVMANDEYSPTVKVLDAAETIISIIILFVLIFHYYGIIHIS